jgi:hypothetical protein
MCNRCKSCARRRQGTGHEPLCVTTRGGDVAGRGATTGVRQREELNQVIVERRQSRRPMPGWEYPRSTGQSAIQRRPRRFSTIVKMMLTSTIVAIGA